MQSANKGANKSTSMGLTGLGVLVIIVAAINHWIIKANPVGHTSIILGVIGVIVAAIGVYMGRSS